MSRLLIIRHGIAEETSKSGRDFDRALTDEGRTRVARMGRELKKLELGPELVISSPLRRAVETRKLLADEFGAEDVAEVLEEFAPEGEPIAMFSALRELLRTRTCETVAVVGHLPSAPLFVAAAIGSPRECIELKKAGVAVLHFPGAPAPGRGTLELLLAPRVYF